MAWILIPAEWLPAIPFGRFEKGTKAYLAGQWRDAASILAECHNMCPNDQPARAILSYMAKLSFVSPDDWAGHRPLAP